MLLKQCAFITSPKRLCCASWGKSYMQVPQKLCLHTNPVAQSTDFYFSSAHKLHLIISQNDYVDLYHVPLIGKRWEKSWFKKVFFLFFSWMVLLKHHLWSHQPPEVLLHSLYSQACRPFLLFFLQPTAAQFPPAPHWPTAPEAVVVNPGPDRSGTENSIFMIRMSDLVKISHWISFLMQCPCYFCPCKNGAGDGKKAEDQCVLQTYFGH